MSDLSKALMSALAGIMVITFSAIGWYVAKLGNTQDDIRTELRKEYVTKQELVELKKDLKEGIRDLRSDLRRFSEDIKNEFHQKN